MLSKAKIKYIKSLQIKKFRKEHGEFVVEGAKSVLELLASDFHISGIWATREFSEKHRDLIAGTKAEAFVVSEEDLARAGSFETNNAALAIARIKENKRLLLEGDEFALILDDVRDPGNLGTIIRIADWFGIGKIICSENTADFYNSKVISASMGSFTRVSVYYTSLPEYLSAVEGEAVYGALLAGENVHTLKFKKRGFILMGNESSGIQPGLLPFITQKVTIPGKGKAESLNVGVATAILCDNILR